MTQPYSTRDRLLAEARNLFAERGFYGVSIAQVAAELNMTKQALLHHFGTKERLYGEVLASIAAHFAARRATVSPNGTAAEQLRDYIRTLIADTPEKIENARLLMREILDNRERIDRAGSWYLKPFLEELMAMLRAVPGWGDASEAQLMAAGIQIFGAISYQAVSGPTFRGIFSAQTAQEMDQAFTPQFEQAIVAILDAGPPSPACPYGDVKR